MPSKLSDSGFQCGILSGLAVTAALNPWDRALYLSIINKRPFFSRVNFRDPYRGLMQSLFGRVFSSGLYFPLEEVYSEQIGSAALAGLATGVTIGVMLNPLSIIKYQTWGDDANRSFLRQVRHMYHHAGMVVFTRGMVATAIRDSIFGLVFSLRKAVPLDDTGAGRFVVGTAAGGLATVCASPFNFMRNISYAQKAELPMVGLVAFWRNSFCDLMHNTRSHGSILARWSYLQMRLGLGLGTLRVAVGMALTESLYTACVKSRLS